MATRIVVPDAGQTTDEMLLVKWHVDVEDEVEVGDFLADIETDKAVGELESHVAGHVLKLVVDEGDTVTTGQTLLWIGEPGEPVPDDPSAPTVEGASALTEATPALEREPLSPHPPASDLPPARATPAARTLARERGVDLTSIVGTGPDGCIVKRDVPAAAGEPQPRESDDVRGTSVPLTNMRRAIAARLQQSVREAPHFYVAIDVDMTHALAVREASETRVTITDLILKAAADTLSELPRMNCRFEADAIHYPEDVNIGIAVSVDDGLVVPVLARADQLSLAELADESRRLIANARAGRLPVGVKSTFTVSNLGMYGVKSFSAIINPPEAAILAVGAVDDRLVLAESGIAAAPALTLTLSSDHRIIDGDLAARFLKALKDRLESPRAFCA